MTNVPQNNMFWLLKYDWLINCQNDALLCVVVTFSTEIHCRKVWWIQVFILKLTFSNFNKDIHYVTSNLIHICRCLKYDNKLIGWKREVPRRSSVRNSTRRSSAGKITRRSGAGKITRRSSAGKITRRSKILLTNQNMFWYLILNFFCFLQGESLLF